MKKEQLNKETIDIPSETYTFYIQEYGDENVTMKRSNSYDITKSETLIQIDDYPNASMVLLLAAKADVDGCVKDKEFGEAGVGFCCRVAGICGRGAKTITANQRVSGSFGKIGRSL